MELLLVSLAVLLVVASMPIARNKPKTSLAVYLGIGLFVPYWVGVQAGSQFVPVILAATAWAAMALGQRLHRIVALDVVVVLLGTMSLVLLVFGLAVPSHVLALAGAWLVPYYIGRSVGQRVAEHAIVRIICCISIALAAQSVIEFALDWHPFEGLALPAGPWAVWSPIQYRSVFPRSEGALGHSITMGALISMGIPFVASSRIRVGAKFALIALMAAGVLVTFSRNALISLIVAILLSTLLLSGMAPRSARVGFGVVVAATVLLIAPVYLATIDGGTGVLENSTEYRANFLSTLPDIELFGISSIYTEYAPGQWGWASILYPGDVIVTLDNSLLLDALQFGWVHTALFLGVLLCAFISFIRHRSNVALIAVVSQFFTVATVAMITQLPYLFWLFLGIGASWAQRDSNANVSPVISTTTRSRSLTR